MSFERRPVKNPSAGPRARMGRGELSLFLIVLGGCSLAPSAAGPSKRLGDGRSPAAQCLSLLQGGLVSERVLACFPAALPEVEGALCRTPASDEVLQYAGYGGPMDAEAVREWQAAHCSSESAARERRSILAAAAAGREQLREAIRTVWDPVVESLPETLVASWRACRDARYSLTTLGRDSPAIGCTLWGSYDLGGEDEEIELEVEYAGRQQMFDFGTKLTADLVVRGADCGGRAWRKGKRIPGSTPQILRCRRQGRSAVELVVTTKAGSCVRRLPELTDPPWTTLCEGE